jgi:hypothetical protein
VNFNEKPKQYRFVEPNVTRQEMSKTLTKGLGRALTQQEANIIYWLGDCDYETRGVLLDLFKELVEKGEENR